MDDLGVIWDMDGVLVDTGDLHYQAWRAVLPDFGIPIDEHFFRRTFGMNNAGIIREMVDYEPPMELIMEISDRKEEHFRRAARGQVRPLPGVRDCLEALRAAKFRHAIASSAPMANIDTLVDELGLRRYFDGIVSGFDLPGKPDPATFLAAARSINVRPQHAIVVEDAVAGVEGARRAGMKCIAVTTTNTKKALSAADLIVEDLRGLTVTDFSVLLETRQGDKE